MPRIKQTNEQKLITLKEKLAKAKKLKDQYTKQCNSYSAEIDKLEQQARFSIINTIVEDSEKLKSLLDLGIITEEQYNAVTKGEPVTEQSE